MIRTKNIMDSISIESFSDIIKSNPEKVIDNAFKNAEKNKGVGEKAGVLSSLKTNNIVLKLALKRYKDICSGKSGSVPRKYAEELEATEGTYGKRDTKVRFSVRSMYELITSSENKSVKAKVSEIDGGVLELYTRLYETVVSDSKWSDAFNTAYKLHKRGVESASAVFVNYIFMVYALEFLTIALFEHSDDIAQYKYGFVNDMICRKYKSFISATAENVIPILVTCESVKDPKKHVNEIIKIEKNAESSESEEVIPPQLEVEIPELEEVAEEDAVVAALIYGALSIAIAITVIHGIRYIIYSMSCLVVDISKSLQDQSYTLLVSIESLERKLTTLKPDSKEYKDLEKVIERQRYLTASLIDVTNKLAGNDMESVDDIRRKESEDNNSIKDSSGNDDSGSLDI